jgi:putative membrane protein
MIPAYSDHAANERTFLAWVRTGIAIMSFGIVIEKFDLFIQTITISSSADPMRLEKLDRLSGLLGPHYSIAFIAGGLALIAIQTVRFVRNKRLLDDVETHAASGLRNGSIPLALLILLVTAAAFYSLSY